MSKIIAIDFETFYSKKIKVSVKTMIAEQYCNHPMFDAYMVSVSDGKNCWAGHPKDFNWSSLNGATLLSHNAYFDKTVYEALVAKGLAPVVKYADWLCTANMTAYLCNRRSLDMSVEHLLGVKLDKSARSDAAEKHWPADFTEAEQSSMRSYARNDAFYCWLLFNKFGDQWPESERQLSKLTIDQGMYGVQIDTALLDRFILDTYDMRVATEKVLPWLSEAEENDWEEFTTKPTSTKCISEQCRRLGIPSPPVRSDDEEGYEEWETMHGPKHAWIKAVSAWRSINKLLVTFKTVKERLRPDGTLPFGLKYCGAHTRRWAGDARINFQNFRKKPILANEAGLLELDEMKIERALAIKRKTGFYPYWVKAAVDIRNLIIPRPGHKMIVSDLAQIEPRVLAWLCGDHEFLKLVATGVSVYEAFGRVSMNWAGGELKKEDPGLYSLYKAMVLALGYSAGPDKFTTMAMTLSGLDITADDPEFIDVIDPATGETSKEPGHGQRARELVADFRAKNPRITDLWKRMGDGLRASVGSEFVVTLPSGNKLRYEDVRAETRIEPDRKTGKPRRNTVFTVGIGGRRSKAYGGLLVENLCQSLARDVFAHNMLLLTEAGYRVLFSSHDEVILEIPIDKENATAEVNSMMSTTPAWMSGLPVAAETHEVACYTK